MSDLETVFWTDNKRLRHRVYSVIKYIMFNSSDSNKTKNNLKRLSCVLSRMKSIFNKLYKQNYAAYSYSNWILSYLWVYLIIIIVLIIRVYNILSTIITSTPNYVMHAVLLHRLFFYYTYVLSFKLLPWWGKE